MQKKIVDVNSGENESPMYKVAAFIVDKRNLFFLLFIFAAVFCVFSKSWVNVEDDITKYLPESTETRQGLTLMDDEFTTYGTANVMVSNVTYDTALDIQKRLEDINGITGVEFDDTDEHYNNASALFTVTFAGEETDQVSANAMNSLKNTLAGYDVSISSAVGSDGSSQLAAEMNIVTMIAAVIIVAVLLFTSHSFAEVPVLIITFLAAALLNMGTNFFLGTISFISDSVTIVLQLALAIDYAIILIHRYTEEHEHLDCREACIVALSKAIPEISSSSLTTISGLVALAFMQFKIGADLALVLIKAIMLSLLSVFTLMPGLIMVFSKLIDKSVHKNFVPKISPVGKFAFATKYVIPPIFVALIVFAAIYANQCPYCYGTSDLDTPRQSETRIEELKIRDNFGKTNLAALIVPSGDYEKESRLIKTLEEYDEVDSCMGLANIEAMDGYVLTDKLTPRQFSELVDLDYEVAEVLYAAYAISDENYAKAINGLDTYSVPLIDMFMFAYDEVNKGYVTLDGEMMDTLNELHDTLSDALLQLKTDKYSRILVYLNLPEEGEETFRFLDTIHEEAEKLYPQIEGEEKSVYLVGNSTSDYDLSKSFVNDNLMVSILSALFVIIILLFTFKSAGLPVLLIMVIQGAIWMNFSFPTIEGTPLFFLSYLIVNSIQMGANIDYAIVISSRYMELKKTMPIKDAITETLNQAFPTIITSGAILAAAGILIGQISTDGTISSVGSCIGRGTIISIILVMFVLPQILIIGDMIIEKTSFTLKKLDRTNVSNGRMAVTGRVRGYVNGRIDAMVSGVIIGDIDARIDSNNDDSSGGESGDTGGSPQDSGANPAEKTEVNVNV